MKLIEWENEYSVHVKEIDKQHYKLVCIINEFYDTIKDKKIDDENLDKIFKGLFYYAKYHYFSYIGYVCPQKMNNNTCYLI